MKTRYEQLMEKYDLLQSTESRMLQAGKLQMAIMWGRMAAVLFYKAQNMTIDMAEMAVVE